MLITEVTQVKVASTVYLVGLYIMYLWVVRCMSYMVFEWGKGAILVWRCLEQHFCLGDPPAFSINTKRLIYYTDLN